MSGETEKEVSGWTVDTLREFFVRLLADHEKASEARAVEYDRRYEERFRAQEEATRAALDGANKAALVLETTAKEWRVQSNEWRAAMDDRERAYLPRTEAMAIEKQNATRISTLIDRFDKLEDRVNSREDQRLGAITAARVVPILLGALLAILGVVSYFNGAP